VIKLAFILAFLLPATAGSVSVTSRPGSNSVSASINFSVTVIESALLAADAHDLGNGVLAYDVHYQRGAHEERMEVIVDKHDGLWLDTTGGQLVAVRRNAHGLRNLEAYAKR
jgi:hypothetical protein